LINYIYVCSLTRWRYRRRRTWTVLCWRFPTTCLYTTIPSMVGGLDASTLLTPVRCQSLPSPSSPSSFLPARKLHKIRTFIQRIDDDGQWDGERDGIRQSLQRYGEIWSGHNNCWGDGTGQARSLEL